MTDSYERSRTQTFTEEELEQFDSDAAEFLTQEELEERLGVALLEVEVEWDESQHIDNLLPGIEPEFYDIYLVYADKLNPFTVIFTKDDDTSDYYRIHRPEDLSELKESIAQWVQDCGVSDMEEQDQQEHYRRFDENRNYD